MDRDDAKYVDNNILSFQHEENLLEYHYKSRTLFAKAGFNLCAWSSNSKELKRRATIENVNDSDSLVKILCLCRNTESDTITFSKQESPVTEKETFTKREVLRQLSKGLQPTWYFKSGNSEG